MQITSFRDLYIAELQELCDMKRELASAHGRFATAASSRELTGIYERHAEETREQVHRIEQLLLRKHKANPDAHQDQAMQGLIRESEKMIALIPPGELRDVALIDSSQKIAHYEIAAFGNAAALAGQLDFRDDQTILFVCLEEERHTDGALTRLAKGAINPSAVAAAA